jgi:hypothetical protein
MRAGVGAVMEDIGTELVMEDGGTEMVIKTSIVSVDIALSYLKYL